MRIFSRTRNLRNLSIVFVLFRQKRLLNTALLIVTANYSRETESQKKKKKSPRNLLFSTSSSPSLLEAKMGIRRDPCNRSTVWKEFHTEKETEVSFLALALSRFTYSSWILLWQKMKERKTRRSRPDFFSSISLLFFTSSNLERCVWRQKRCMGNVIKIEKFNSVFV